MSANLLRNLRSAESVHTERRGRHELKHAISPADAAAIRRRMGTVAHADPHAGPDGSYRVRSLYFDNLDNKALLEKRNGLDNREKFRIRLYNGDPSFISLEKKSKRQGVCFKQSARLTEVQCRALLQGDTSWMTGHPLLVELRLKMRTQQLRPRTLVDYRREAFVYPAGNVRITLDSDLRTGLASTELFRSSLPLPAEPGSLPILLEVKYDAFLPTLIRDLAQVPNRQAAAFSKYDICRSFL
ncbi:MAG: polyphosphate polymerase domain-containing protein [Clostridiales bacterium]|nr:polyphosphate polymerase domain-containing protein [Clostridiales bacterium]